MKWIPKVLSLVMLWGAVASTVMLVEPDLLKDIFIPGIYLPFFGLLGFTIWYTLALLIKSIWKSLFLTVTIVGGLILSTLGLMHMGLMIVLLLTFAIQSWYIYHYNEKANPSHEQKNRRSGL